jgi:hypothetical protein
MQQQALHHRWSSLVASGGYPFLSAATKKRPGVMSLTSQSTHASCCCSVQLALRSLHSPRLLCSCSWARSNLFILFLLLLLWLLLTVATASEEVGQWLNLLQCHRSLLGRQIDQVGVSKHELKDWWRQIFICVDRSSLVFKSLVHLQMR